MIRNFTSAISIICFGWPAVIASILLAVAGLLLRRARLLMVAGVIFLPFTYYLSNGLRNPLVIMPFFFFASAFAVSRRNTRLAWLLFLPLVIVTLWLAFVVLTQ